MVKLHFVSNSPNNILYQMIFHWSRSLGSFFFSKFIQTEENQTKLGDHTELLFLPVGELYLPDRMTI